MFWAELPVPIPWDAFMLVRFPSFSLFFVLFPTSTKQQYSMAVLLASVQFHFDEFFRQLVLRIFTPRASCSCCCCRRRRCCCRWSGAELYLFFLSVTLFVCCIILIGTWRKLTRFRIQWECNECSSTSTQFTCSLAKFGRVAINWMKF